MRILSGSTKLAFGFGLGVVAAGALKDVLPAFRGLGRPLLKATVKSGLILARDSRFQIARFREALADAAAEAEAELSAEPVESLRDERVAENAKAAAGTM